MVLASTVRSRSSDREQRVRGRLSGLGSLPNEGGPGDALSADNSSKSH